MSAEKIKTILLVEDEAISALAGKITLENYGNKVMTAYSGEEAVEAVEKTPAIDLVLMDINLGAGIDGTEAAEIILRNHDLPVVFLSGHTEAEVVGRTEKITSYGYIVKSSSSTVLDASIKMAFKLFEAKTREKEKESQREAALAALQESEALFRGLYDNMKSGSAIFTVINNGSKGSDYIIKKINNAGLKMEEKTLADVVGKKFSDIRPAIDDYGLIPLMKKVWGSGKAAVLSTKMYMDERYSNYYENYIFKLPSGEIVTLYDDVTERKRIEEELRESEARYRSLFETMDEGFCVVEMLYDPAGKANDYRFVEINPAFEKHSGLQQALGKTIRQMVPDHDAHWFEIYEKVARTGEAIRFEKPDLAMQKYYTVFAFRIGGDGSRRVGIIFSDISERNQAEEALRESEEMFREMAEQLEDVLFKTDDHGTITYISPSASRVFGWLPGEMIGRSFTEFLLESEIPKAMQAFQATISTGQPNRSLILMMKRRNNSVFLGELKGSPLDKKRSGKGTLGLIRDISERKRTESQKEAALEELKKSSQLLKDSGEIANIGGWELDLSTQELSWTEEVCRIHGVEPGYTPTLAEAVNFYAPEHRGAIEKVLKKTAETGAPFDLEVLFIPRGSKDKIWVRSLGKAVYSDGKIAKLAGTIQNIDKYRRVEAALGESEMRFRELFNRMSSGVAVYEAVDNGGDFIIRDFNPAAEKIEQVSSKDIIGKRVSEAFPGVKAFGVFKVFQRVWQTGEAEYYPENIYKNEKNSGSWQESWRESWVFKLPTGEIVSIYNDISERKQAGEEIKRQLAEKEILLKEVHHRIKNNIASIGGLLTLQAQAVTNPEAIAVLQDAIGRVTSMQILYDKLLLSEGYKDISVKNYVESLAASVVALLPGSAKVTIEQRITDFQLDPKQLSPLGIIINELLTNIMKHAFTNRDTGLIQISLTNVDKHVTLTIQDDGNGLPAGFDINESQGFGLMLVKMLSQQLGGSFSIKMHEGTLCTVEFDI